jgi:hypothetical protein
LKKVAVAFADDYFPLSTGTTTRGSGAAVAPIPYGLLLAIFAQNLGVVNDVEAEPVSRITI